MNLGPKKLTHYGEVLVKETLAEGVPTTAEFRGQHWETYLPEGDEDPRVFERCCENGRVIQTM